MFFNLLFWNVDGLRSKLNTTDFLDFVCSYDIVGLFETWTNDFNLCETFDQYLSFSVDAVKTAIHGRLSGVAL